MDAYILLAHTECRIRRLEADILRLKRIEVLRHLAEEQGSFLRRNAFTVIGAMALLGLFFDLLIRLG